MKFFNNIISGYIILNILDFLIYPIFMVVSAPLIMSMFGDVGYGFWVIVLSLLALANLFNLGISNTSLQYINNSKISENTARRSVWILIFLTIIVTIFSIILGVYFKGDILINLSYGISLNSICLIILCLVAEQYDYQNGAFLKANDRIRTNSVIDILAKLFMYSLGLYFVFKFESMHYFVVTVLATFIMKIISKRLFLLTIYNSKSLKSSLKNAKINLKEFALTSMGFFFMAFNGFALVIGERFFLSNMYDLDEIGKIALGSQIIFFIHSVPAAGMSFLLPVLSAGTRNVKFVRMLILNIVLSLLMLSVVVLFIEVGGLEVWLGRDDIIIKQVVYGLLLPVFLYSLCIAPYYFTMSNNKGFILSILILCASVLFLLSVYILRDTFTDIDSFLRIKYIYIITLTGVIYGHFIYKKIIEKEFNSSL